MDHLFDEFSKSLVESVPRRESLRRLGALFAGAVLSPLGMDSAWGGPKPRGGSDPCQAVCKCGNAKQQNQCLKVCRACQSDTSRTCGTCGSYVCCAAGQSCCSGHCTSLQNDVQNCGGCSRNCGAPAANQSVACTGGLCTYNCVAGAEDCGNGTCTFLDSDPDNCGACGNVCPDSAPVCMSGTCSTEAVCVFPFVSCGGVCVDPTSDPENCGGCGVQCAASEACIFGFCESGGG